MEQIKKLRATILKKATEEYHGRIEALKKLPVEQVISKAYEIVMKEEFLIMLEHGEHMDMETLQVLNRLEYLLSKLYLEWLEQDHDLTEELTTTLSMVVSAYLEDLDVNQDDENKLEMGE